MRGKYNPRYNSHRMSTWIQLDCIFDDLVGMFYHLKIELNYLLKRRYK